MIRRAAEFMEEEAGDELLLLDLGSGMLHRLNVTARFVWDMTKEVNDVGEMIELYKDQFSLDGEQANSDVTALLRQFVDQGLLIQE